MTAYHDHRAKITLFNRLSGVVTGAVSTLTREANWLFNAGTIMAGLGGAAMEFNASALTGTAKTLGDDAAANLVRLRASPGASGLSHLYDDLDHYSKLGASADDLADAAKGLKSDSIKMPIKIGGALAAAGIVYDIANGQDPVQATASGLGGFAASVGAGWRPAR